MKEINVSLSTIEEKALQLAADKASWHFHILTKDCLLNKHSKVALIIENPKAGEYYLSLCDKKPMKIGKRLVELLHGADITDKAKQSSNAVLSQDETAIVQRAKELSSSGVMWHHHMLFPDCFLNRHQNQWTIVLEDRLNDTLLTSVSDEEPKSALREIETIFYAQKP
jgi:hypothetical protein